MTASTPFAFSRKDLRHIDDILKKFPPHGRWSAVIPLLYLAQKANGGWLSSPALEAVAEILEMPYIKVYEIATFYTMFYLKPMGKHRVQVCTTTPCWLRGSDAVMAACEKRLGIKEGETTADGLFTLLQVECLGACVNAPVVQIDDDFREDLTPEAMTKILDDLMEADRAEGESKTPPISQGETGSAFPSSPSLAAGGKGVTKGPPRKRK